MTNAELKKRLFISAAIVLVVGLGSALGVYLSAPNDPDNMLIYQYENSKKYRHDLELMGGKANMLADQFYRWFDGLWHGRELATTLSFMTIVTSSGCFLVARHLPDDSSPFGQGDDADRGE